MEIINPADIVAFGGVDDATAALIFQSYLDDSKQLFEESQARSKNRQDVLSDYQIALKLNQEEMQRGAGLVQDRQMSKSIRQAVLDDAQSIAAAQAQEQAAFEDRRVSESEFQSVIQIYMKDFLLSWAFRRLLANLVVLLRHLRSQQVRQTIPYPSTTETLRSW
jgi:hypothetical protein